MLKAEEQMELAVLKKHGASIRGLSRSTGRSRNTVRRYLRGGDAVAKRKPAPKRAEKLDPFKAYIVGRMKAALPDRIPATVLFREIKVPKLFFGVREKFSRVASALARKLCGGSHD